MKAQQAGVDSAQAALKVAQRQIDTLRAQRASAEASLAQAQAQLDHANLNLGYTTVIADQPGRVVNLTGAVGQYAQAGTNLTMFVPDEIWVTETTRRPSSTACGRGNRSTWRSTPTRNATSRVMSPASSPAPARPSRSSPPENATGNFVKIVQRVPVKIILDNPPADVSLGPGMSVVPTVRVEPTPSLYERLRARVEQWWGCV